MSWTPNGLSHLLSWQFLRLPFTVTGFPVCLFWPEYSFSSFSSYRITCWDSNQLEYDLNQMKFIIN